MPKVLVTRRVFPEALDILRTHAEIEVDDAGSGGDLEALKRRLKGKHGLVCQLTDRVTAEVIRCAPELQVIANIAVGVDNIDIGAATENRVLVTRTLCRASVRHRVLVTTRNGRSRATGSSRRQIADDG